MKKNKKCTGTIYKINNKTYCVGEKRKKTKKFKRKHRSKKSLMGGMNFVTSTVAAAARVFALPPGKPNPQGSPNKPLPKKLILDDLKDVLIEVSRNDIKLKNDVDLKNEQNNNQKLFVSKNEHYLFDINGKYYTTKDKGSIKTTFNSIIINNFHKYKLEKYSNTRSSENYNSPSNNSNPYNSKPYVPPSIYMLYPENNIKNIYYRIIPTEIYEKDSKKYYVLDYDYPLN